MDVAFEFVAKSVEELIIMFPKLSRWVILFGPQEGALCWSAVLLQCQTHIHTTELTALTAAGLLLFRRS